MVDPEDDEGGSTSCLQHVTGAGETSSNANVGGYSGATQPRAFRGDFEGNVDVIVAVAKDDAEVRPSNLQCLADGGVQKRGGRRLPRRKPARSSAGQHSLMDPSGGGVLSAFTSDRFTKGPEVSPTSSGLASTSRSRDLQVTHVSPCSLRTARSLDFATR